MVVVHNREIKFDGKMSKIDLALTATACRRVSWTHKHLGSSPESRSSAEVWTRGNPLVLQRSAEKLRNSWAIIETCEKLQMNARLGQEMRRQNVVDSTANRSSYCAVPYCDCRPAWHSSYTTADEKRQAQQTLLMKNVWQSRNCWLKMFGTAETVSGQRLAQQKPLMKSVCHSRNCW